LPIPSRNCLHVQTSPHVCVRVSVRVCVRACVCACMWVSALMLADYEPPTTLVLHLILSCIFRTPLALWLGAQLSFQGYPFPWPLLHGLMHSLCGNDAHSWMYTHTSTHAHSCCAWELSPASSSSFHPLPDPKWHKLKDCAGSRG